MHTLNEVLELARQLPPEERERLRAELDALAAEEPEAAPEKSPYASLLALVGKGESDYTDVASDKYKHVADATYEHKHR